MNGLGFISPGLTLLITTSNRLSQLSQAYALATSEPNKGAIGRPEVRTFSPQRPSAPAGVENKKQPKAINMRTQPSYLV